MKHEFKNAVGKTLKNNPFSSMVVQTICEQGPDKVKWGKVVPAAKWVRQVNLANGDILKLAESQTVALHKPGKKQAMYYTPDTATDPSYAGLAITAFVNHGDCTEIMAATPEEIKAKAKAAAAAKQEEEARRAREAELEDLRRRRVQDSGNLMAIETDLRKVYPDMPAHLIATLVATEFEKNFGRKPII